MQRVGNKLSEIALASNLPEETDIFGRSAFNRYYYASFLVTRRMLTQLDPIWGKTSHGGIPTLLEEAVISRIRKEANKQEKAGVLSKASASNIRRTAATAVGELSQLLRIAYSIRVVADYEPDRQISRNGQILKLLDHSSDEARRWSGRADVAVGTILNNWRQLGIS